MTYYEHNSRATSWDVIELDADLSPYQVAERSLSDREASDLRLMFASYWGRAYIPTDHEG